MKTILRNTAVNTLALFVLSQIVTGVKIEGGILTYVFGGLALFLLFSFLKPALNIISLPLNLVTLGLFSFVTNAIILYLLTVFVPQIKISAFVFSGAKFAGFIVPRISFNDFFAFIVCAFLLSVIVGFITWLIKR